jgi:hypothetical protein
MTTLHDLKQALDSGETLCRGLELIWKSADQYFYDDVDRRPLKVNWETLVQNKFTTPSDWRIRDQIGAEETTHDGTVLWNGKMDAEWAPDPTIMAVPIDEWNALQEELKELRAYKAAKTGSVWMAKPIGLSQPSEMAPEQREFVELMKRVNKKG